MNLKIIIIPLLVFCLAFPAIGFISTVDEPVIAVGSRSYTHTVFAEDLSTTWCVYCPTASHHLEELYNEGMRDFYFVSLVGDMVQEADDRINEYNIVGYPTVEFDGGYKEVSGAQLDSLTYASTIDACGARNAKDIGIDIQVSDEGSAILDVSVVLTNREEAEYSGTLKVYLTEKVSRYIDYDGDPYPFGFIGYAIDEPFSVASNNEYSSSATWDGAGKTDMEGNDFSDIDPDNILAIAVVFNSEAKNMSRTTTSDKKYYNAYFADSCEATEPVAAEGIPLLKVTNPTNYERVDGIVTITAEVTSSNSDIQSVETRIDEGAWNQMSGSGSSYTYNWDTTAEPAGNYKIEIRIRDASGNETIRRVTARVKAESIIESSLEITDLKHSPLEPDVSDIIRITCTVSSSGADIDYVQVQICKANGDICFLPEDMEDIGGGSYSFDVSSLDEAMEYYYLITARDIDGNSKTTEKNYFTVQEDPDDDGGGPGAGLIVGIAAVIILLLVVIIIGVVVVKKKKDRD